MPTWMPVAALALSALVHIFTVVAFFGGALEKRMREVAQKVVAEDEGIKKAIEAATQQVPINARLLEGVEAVQKRLDAMHQMIFEALTDRSWSQRKR